MTNMGKMLVLPCTLLLLMQMIGGDIPPAIIPPAGYSPVMVAKTHDALQKYTCTNEKWTWTGSRAVLLDANTSQSIGSFLSTKTVDKKGGFTEVGTWTLSNSPGDAIEGGGLFSSVAARVLVSVSQNGNNASLPQLLLEAVNHTNSGAAALISYIQRYDTIGGLPPCWSECTDNADGIVVDVPFSTYYSLWSQDSVPPPLPAALQMKDASLAVGFFSEGAVTYKYNGSGWEENKRSAKLYNIPGGPILGALSHKPGTDEWWKIYDPSGFFVEGKPRITVKVTDTSYPWTLNTVVKTTTQSLLGPFKYALSVSTRGGLPPQACVNATDGMIWRSRFSAVVWFYT